MPTSPESDADGPANTQVGRPERDFDPHLPDAPTLVHAFAATVGRSPDRDAILDGDRTITFRQYRNAVASYASRLNEFGVAGQRVAVMMHNSAEVAIVSMAVMVARGTVVPMNYDYPELALLPLVEDVSPVAIVCDDTTAAKGAAIAERLGIEHLDVFSPEGITIDDWLDDDSVALPKSLPEPSDVALMIFTGGTTGIPKAAAHTYANDMAYAKITATMWGFGLDCERILNVAPNFHIWGFSKTVISPVFMGATVDIHRAYQPARVLERIESKGITIFAGGPAAMYIGLRANENYKTTDFSKLRYGLAGGSPCPEDLLRGWEEETGCPILEGWGMTEGAPCNVNPAVGVRKVGSTGVTPPHTMVDVVDVDTGTIVLPPGERGELRMKGPQFVSEYFNRPEETSLAFRDGWLYSGDIGYFDDDGYMFLVDRKKELIIVGGYNVYPREIDEVLHDHPAILEAAAVGAPDEFRGETVKVCIALNAGHSLTAEEVIDYCRERLVKYKVPTQVEFLDELPKTGPGKIDKLRLKGLR